MTDQTLQLLLKRLDHLTAEFNELREGVKKAVRISDDDPEMALTRARKVLEYVVRDVFALRCQEDPGTRPLENILQRLVKDGHLPKRLGAYASYIRDLGNVGTHVYGEELSKDDVRRSFENLTAILEWYFERVRPDAFLQVEVPALVEEDPRPRLEEEARLREEGLAQELVREEEKARRLIEEARLREEQIAQQLAREEEKVRRLQEEETRRRNEETERKRVEAEELKRLAEAEKTRAKVIETSQAAPTLYAPQPEDQATSPDSPVKRRSRGRLLLTGFACALLLVILLAGGIYLWITRDYAKQTLTGHTWIVDWVTYSPDGKMLASASTHEINLWDAQTGALKQTLKSSAYWFESVALSPDGKLLASVSGGTGDQTVKLWDVQTGELKQSLIGHDQKANAFVSVAFSPDGKTLATGSYFWEVKLWDVQTGDLKQTFAGHTWIVDWVAFSPDGKTLASMSDWEHMIKLWDVQTGTLKQTLAGVHPFAFSPDGKTLASRAGEVVKLWDVQTGALKQTLTDPRIGSVAFSPDGKTVACGSWDKTVKLWDVQTGALKQTLIGHRGEVNSVAFSPDGKTLASAAGDRKVKLWKVE